MRTSAASEHRLDRLVGRRQLLNWRWWVALAPVVVVLVTLHVVAAIGIAMRDVFDWLSFRGWRLHYRAMQAAKRFVKFSHGVVFREPAPPNTRVNPSREAASG